MKRAVVILNEQHTLMNEQKKILDELYDSWEIYPVPATGWTLDEQKKQAERLSNHPADKIIGSPVPYLIMTLAAKQAANYEMAPARPLIFTGRLFLFHNDKREKKELPGGKIINVVADTGWSLVSVTN